MMAENEDSFMRTFAKNYARIKDPRAKLKFYTGAMENMKARGMKPKDFLSEFRKHSEAVGVPKRKKVTENGGSENMSPYR